MTQEFQTNTFSGSSQRPFTEDRRKRKRRSSVDSGAACEKRSRGERRLDANWRYALIRRRLNG